MIALTEQMGYPGLRGFAEVEGVLGRMLREQCAPRTQSLHTTPNSTGQIPYCHKKCHKRASPPHYQGGEVCLSIVVGGRGFEPLTSRL